MDALFRAISVPLQNNGSAKIQVPVLCPACGTIMAPKYINRSSMSVDGFSYNLMAFHTNCCESYYFALYRVKAGLSIFEYLTHYPSLLPAKIPESLLFSTRFVSLYSQAHTAEQNGHIELAGSGYRNALEVLIKDFAIEKLKKSREEVIGKKLWRVIEDYLPQVSIKNNADIVRLLGNDNTHYERDYPGLGFEVLKRHLRVFIDRIDAEVLSLEPEIEMRRMKHQSEDTIGAQPDAGS